MSDLRVQLEGSLERLEASAAVLPDPLIGALRAAGVSVSVLMRASP